MIAPRRVSVIVPTKNRSRQLREALSSIRALEGPDLEFELIVVDNGSTDDSIEVARDFGARVLRTLAPGAALARNEGLRSASADFVAFLDDDDVWLPGHIRSQLDVLHAHADFAAAVGQIVLTDYDLRNPGEPYPTQLPRTGHVFTAFLGQLPQVGSTVVRTTVRDTVGYFDPNCEGDEDWDWHLRIALHHKVGFVAVPCMLFRQRPIGATADQEWRRLRNTRRVFFSNLRRAGRQRPGVLTAARILLRHSGTAYAYFVAHARERCAAGKSEATLRALGRAVLSSPPHALIHARRDRLLRMAAGALVGAYTPLTE